MIKNKGKWEFTQKQQVVVLPVGPKKQQQQKEKKNTPLQDANVDASLESAHSLWLIVEVSTCTYHKLLWQKMIFTL